MAANCGPEPKPCYATENRSNFGNLARKEHADHVEVVAKTSVQNNPP